MRTFTRTDDEYDEDTDGYEIVDGKKILKNGYTMTVPLMLADSMPRERIAVTKTEPRDRITATRTTPASPVKTFDARAHRPHAVALTDSDRTRRQEQQRKSDAALSERWRNPPSAPLPSGLQQPTRVPSPTAAAEALRLEAARKPATASDLDAAYKRRDAALSERWKGGAA